MTAMKRAGLRIAYRILRVYWFVARPRARGVKCLLERGDEVLLVRHTYGRRRRWDMPGGGVRRHETPLDAARREVREEVGMAVDEWRALGELTLRVDGKRNELFGFAARVEDSRLTRDPVEIAEVRWFPRGELPAELAPWVSAFVERS